jgi:hypothetical protein
MMNAVFVVSSKAWIKCTVLFLYPNKTLSDDYFFYVRYAQNFEDHKVLLIYTKNMWHTTHVSENVSPAEYILMLYKFINVILKFILNDFFMVQKLFNVLGCQFFAFMVWKQFFLTFIIIFFSLLPTNISCFIVFLLFYCCFFLLKRLFLFCFQSQRCKNKTKHFVMIWYWNDLNYEH